jgi:hypothetical protein
MGADFNYRGAYADVRLPRSRRHAGGDRGQLPRKVQPLQRPRPSYRGFDVSDSRRGDASSEEASDFSYDTEPFFPADSRRRTNNLQEGSSSTEREVKTKSRTKRPRLRDEIQRLEEKIKELTLSRPTNDTKPTPEVASIAPNPAENQESKPPATPPPNPNATATPPGRDFSTPSRKPELTLSSSQQELPRYRMILEELPQSIDGILATSPLQRYVVGEASPLASPRSPATPSERIRSQDIFTDRPQWSPSSSGYAAPPGSFPQWPASPSQSQPPSSGSYPPWGSPLGYAGQPNAFDSRAPSTLRQCTIM